MNDRSDSIKKATVGIALLVLVSKGLGFLREAVIACKFGTGIEYDVYLIGISIPAALYALFGYSFYNLLIPDYSRAAVHHDKRSAMAKVLSEFYFALFGSLAAALLIIVAAPYLIHLIAPGLDSRHLPEAVLIVRVSSSIIILSVLESFFRSVLNSEKRFIIPAAGPILANIVVISSVILLAGRISTKAILYGLVTGYLAQVAFVFVPFRRIGFLKYIHARVFERNIGRFFVTAVIILIIEGASQVYAVVDRYFASFMEAGVVSALGYAYILLMLPISIFAYALSTAIFPFLSDAFVDNDRSRSGYLLSRGISISLLLALPVTVIFWVFADQIVMLLFRRGAFDLESVEITSNLLRYFALGLVGQFLLWIMSRAYYAAKKYHILMAQVAVMLIAKIALAAPAVNAFGYIGLAISSSISYTLGAILLLIFAGKCLTPIDARRLLMYFSKLAVSTAAGWLAAQFLKGWIVADKESFFELAVSLGIAVFASLVVFIAVSYLMNIADVRNLSGIWRRKHKVDANSR